MFTARYLPSVNYVTNLHQGAFIDSTLKTALPVLPKLPLPVNANICDVGL